MSWPRLRLRAHARLGLLLSLAEPLGLLPGPDHVFPPGDVLLLLGTDAQLAAFTKDT